VIARIWRGWAPLATADDYQHHYETEVAETMATRSCSPRSRSSSAWTPTRGFAGDDYELAVVEEAARQALSRWDERVSRREVVAKLE